LGLLAVGTWQAYSDVDSKVDEEASVLAALYRNVSTFPDPKRAELQADLREYARQVIDVAWPLQQRGIVPQNTAAIVQAFQTHPLRQRFALLTPREREVMERVVAGLLNKQIGAELGTSETTVKIHRHQVMEKMGAGSLPELVRMADRLGIIVRKS